MEAKITVFVPEELHRQAQVASAARGETLSDVVRAALEEYIQSGKRSASEMLEKDSVLSLRFESGYTDTAARAEEILADAIDPKTGFRID